MTISGIGGGTNTGAAGVRNQTADSYSKSLQKQIADAQKQLQELSQNDEMDPDTKLKKRQEIQKQVSDLNIKLRQHQMEERRKDQQERQQNSGPRRQEGRGQGLSGQSMEAVLSADHSLRQAKAQGNMAGQLENSAAIKRTEIKLDGGSAARSASDNASVSSKWDEVESMEQHAEAAAAAQMSLLADVQSRLNEAAAADSTGAQAEKKKAEGTEEAAAERTEETAGTEEAAPSAQSEQAPVSGGSAEPSAAIGGSIDIKL